jgi:hypothetical protein
LESTPEHHTARDDRIRTKLSHIPLEEGLKPERGIRSEEDGIWVVAPRVISDDPELKPVDRPPGPRIQGGRIAKLRDKDPSIFGPEGLKR